MKEGVEELPKNKQAEKKFLNYLKYKTICSNIKYICSLNHFPMETTNYSD